MNPAPRHPIESKLLDQRIDIAMVGAGATGSQIASHLARLHLTLTAIGHPHGIHLTLVDPDNVSDANLGRQLFSPSDVGQPKAHIIINRLNHFFGLNWSAEAHTFQHWKDNGYKHENILISCVDTKATRREIHQYVNSRNHPLQYWIDTGNSQQSGQVIIGQPIKPSTKKENAQPRLRLVTEIYPELLDRRLKEDNHPSCSVAEALETQDLFINTFVATLTAQLLWSFLRKGYLDHNGYLVNLRTNAVRTIPIQLPALQKSEKRGTKRHSNDPAQSQL